jgi:hypothetical protein
LAIAQTAVKPPAAAARVPEADGLLVLEAGLAQVHVDVDEPRAHDLPGGVEDRGAVGHGQLAAHALDAAAADEHVLHGVRRVGGDRPRDRS